MRVGTQLQRRTIAETYALGLIAATAVTLILASPVKAGSVIVSTKSARPPVGFYGVCERYAWACAAHSARERRMHDADVLAVATRVNLTVNRRVREISDQLQYRKAEVWALPTKRGGDCEDFALLKKLELMRRGVSPNRLLIATVLTERLESHAVLILRTDAGDLVLDNRRERIKPWRESGYSFIRMQNPKAPERWRMIMAGGVFE